MFQKHRRKKQVFQIYIVGLGEIGGDQSVRKRMYESLRPVESVWVHFVNTGFRGDGFTIAIEDIQSPSCHKMNIVVTRMGDEYKVFSYRREDRARDSDELVDLLKRLVGKFVSYYAPEIGDMIYA